ncbi:hypothetical protein [Faecalicatena contorta]|uniref:ABC-2 family transporter protein n=1 Tax=Faecalicatena contorta TaxID=39482 RepID=A0A315ZSH2_9FIRM|nr:hypothetical protein [Faecalicatena contorta]PWJ47890.1 hypothetical protein A8805_1159 [Faecalicatena contorta]SUQ15653.1 hypothetical protein SAMN05216529_1159 [Faecalicatena contorta]
MKRIFQIEFKRRFYSAGFYVSILLLVAAGAIGSYSTVEYIRDMGLPKGEIRFIVTVYQALYSEAFTFILPIACTLVASASYLEDLQSGILRYVMLRTTKKRYRWSKVINCALFGMFVIVIAFLLMLVIFFTVFFPNHGEIQYLKTLDIPYISQFLQRVVVLGLNGSFYALLGGAIAIITNNKYMAYAAPFIFYYVISTLLGAYFTGAYIINPKEWLLVRFSLPGVILAILAVVNIIVIICYSKIMERRCKNE